MKDRSSPIVKWILILFILPPLLAVVLPFIMIFRIAFMPEGLATTKEQDAPIWSMKDTFADSEWDVWNGAFLSKSETPNTPLHVEWSGISEKNHLSLKYPMNHNIADFAAVQIEYQTDAPSFIIGFIDAQGSKASVEVKTSQGKWSEKRIDFSALDIDSIDAFNLSNIFIKVEHPADGYLKIRSISCCYKLFSLANFKNVIKSASFGRYFFNSIFISLMIMLANIVFSTMAGFAFAWRSFPLRRTLYVSMMAMIMIPVQVLMIPTFILIQELQWLNTYKALIVPFLIYPINIFLMRQYISKIPKSFAEVALVDGASYFTIFFKIILPICKPAIAIVGINTFVSSWNSFLYPFILTNTAEMRTLPVGLALYIGLFDVDWAHLMAAASLSAMPVIIVFLIFQKQIIAGMLSGSTQGT